MQRTLHLTLPSSPPLQHTHIRCWSSCHLWYLLSGSLPVNLPLKTILCLFLFLPYCWSSFLLSRPPMYLFLIFFCLYRYHYHFIVFLPAPSSFFLFLLMLVFFSHGYFLPCYERVYSHGHWAFILCISDINFLASWCRKLPGKRKYFNFFPD